jgi:hypothetical protein
VPLSLADEVRQSSLLMRDNYESVGFLPEGAVEQSARDGGLYCQYDNDEWVGYLLVGPLRASVRKADPHST